MLIPLVNDTISKAKQLLGFDLRGQSRYAMRSQVSVIKIINQMSQSRQRHTNLESVQE